MHLNIKNRNMKIYNRLERLIAVFFVVVFLSVGCSSPAPTPEEVTKQYFEALLVEDYITMHALSTEKEAAKYDEAMLVEGAKGTNPEKRPFLDTFLAAERNYKPAEMDTLNPDKVSVEIEFVFPEGKESRYRGAAVMLEKENEQWRIYQMTPMFE